MITDKKIVKIINKVLILIMCLFFILIVLYFVSLFYKSTFLKKYIPLLILVVSLLGTLLMVICPNAFINDHPYAYTYQFLFTKFDDFISFLDNSMKTNGFVRYNPRNKDYKDKVILYTKILNLGKWRENYFVFNFDSIQGSAKDTVASMTKIATNITKNQKNVWRCNIHSIYFICVKKENKVFYEILNNQWGDTDGNVCVTKFVGCSFENKIAYYSEAKYLYIQEELFLLRMIKKIMKFNRKGLIKKEKNDSML